MNFYQCVYMLFFKICQFLVRKKGRGCVRQPHITECYFSGDKVTTLKLMVNVSCDSFLPMLSNGDLS